MRYMPHIHILKPGEFTGEGGRQASFSADDLSAIAQGYNTALHEAPLVIGHPETDHPAYGWVRALSVDSGGLYADADQVDPQFAEMVRAGRFKKISVGLYGPRHPSNPTPGVWALRHVGFLGAQPPAVKGLRQAELGETDDDIQIQTTDIQPTDIQSMEEPTEMPAKTTTPPATTIVNNVTPEGGAPAPGGQLEDSDSEIKLAERTRKLVEREAVLEAAELALAEHAQAIRREQIEAAIEEIVKEGRILPADRVGLTALCEAIAVAPVELVLAEGKGAAAKVVKTDTAQWFSDWLTRLPVQVEYAELTAATPATEGDPSGGISLPPGYTVDPASAALHQKALALAEKGDLSYEEALTKTQPTKNEG